MNNSYQSKNGFKTFLITLVISLGIFGLLYYVVTDFSNRVDINQEVASAQNQAESDLSNEVDIDKEVASAQSQAETPKPEIVPEEKKDEQQEDKTVFGELAAQDMDKTKKAVLGAAETTQSTSAVPATGTNGMLIASIISATAFVAGAFILYVGPRKLALSKFEKEITKNLD